MIRKSSLYLLGTSILLGGCTVQATKYGGTMFVPELKDTVFYLNDEYRTGGSASAILGSYGRILVNETASFERIGLINNESFKTKIRGIAKIANTTEGLASVKIDFKSIANLEGGEDLKNEEEFKITIHEIVDLDKLESSINKKRQNNPRVEFKLKDQNVRVITAVAVIYNHKALSIFSEGIKSELYWNNNSFFEFKGKDGKNKQLSIGDGVSVAYQFSRLCWSKDGEVVALVRDRHGHNECPFGSLLFHPDYGVSM